METDLSTASSFYPAFPHDLPQADRMFRCWRVVQMVRRLLAFALLFFIIAPGRAEISLPPSRLPQPVPITVDVRRGESVTITFRIYGKRTEDVRFKIRSQPQLGKLSGVTPTGRDTATIVYRNSGDVTHLHDSFTYAAQTSDGVSGPAEVTINVLEDPPILAIPDEINFGNVLAGGTSQREFTVENRGGGLVEGNIEADLPWRIDGNNAYRLGHGESQSFTVTLATQEGRALRGEIRYSSHADRVTTLKAASTLPFTVAQKDLEL